MLKNWRRGCNREISGGSCVNDFRHVSGSYFYIFLFTNNRIKPSLCLKYISNPYYPGSIKAFNCIVNILKNYIENISEGYSIPVCTHITAQEELANEECFLLERT